MIKRIFDFTVGICALFIFWPIFFVVALMIRKDSQGPIFYRGVRTGQNGKPFRIYKFRTMIPNADKIGGPSTALNDPRLTRTGKFLRKYKLDELPQLLNILRGEMSFVGPRPQVEFYTRRYSGDELLILKVKPGLTDYASVLFINLDEILGDDNVDKKYANEIEPKKNNLRIQYAKNHNFWIDMKIIFMTCLGIFGIKLAWNIPK
jgi:lipopolysaccharide/colanic/teichoic acid biosynthesis glycosyltransferase